MTDEADSSVVLAELDSKVEDLFCSASSGSEPSLFFSNYFFSLGFKPIQDDFARMTDEADSSVVLAELQVAFAMAKCVHLYVYTENQQSELLTFS